MYGECDHCGSSACDGFSCREPCSYCGREHCDGRCEPRCDEPEDCLNCGVCEDCINLGMETAEQDELLRHIAEYDAWQRMTDRQREDRIRREL